MKKLLLTFSALALILSAKAQSSFTTSGFVDSVAGPDSVQLKETFFVVNNAATNKDVKVTKWIIDEIPGTTNSFCFGIYCYPDFVFTSTNAVTLGASGGSDSLLCDYNPYYNAGTSHIRYNFWDINNPNDSLSVIIAFYAWETTGINEVENSGSVSSAYPNPASSMAAFSFTLNDNPKKASVKITDVLGNTIHQISVSGKHGTVILPVSGFETGIYFYSLVADDKTIATKKLVVTH